MKSFKAMAHIHSLGGAMDEITVLDSRQDGTQTVYIVDYKGVKCTAISTGLQTHTTPTISTALLRRINHEHQERYPRADQECNSPL